jgi:hypothetical protein
MTINLLKTGVKPTNGKPCKPNIPQTLDSIKNNWGAAECLSERKPHQKPRSHYTLA